MACCYADVATQNVDLTMKPKHEFSLSALEESPTVARDLSKQFTEQDALVEAMYYQAATVIAYINLQDTSRAFSCARVYPDHPSGQMLEFVTSTPLACSLEQLEAHMWSFAAHKNSVRASPSPAQYCRGV